jgi:hypothetical protein
MPSPGPQQLVPAHSTGQLSVHFPLLDSVPPSFPASQPVKQIYLQGSILQNATSAKNLRIFLINFYPKSRHEFNLINLMCFVDDNRGFKGV